MYGRTAIFCVYAFSVVILGCTASTATSPPVTPPSVVVPPSEIIQDPTQQTVAPAWQALTARLKKDGLYTAQTASALLRLGTTPSEAPMGAKIKELYTSAFLRQSQSKKSTKPPMVVYPNVITAKNIALCQTFIKEHNSAFLAAEKRFAVPKEIAAALLFVETRLGKFLGKESAFLTLASMAASTTPESIPATLSKLPDHEKRHAWIAERTEKRSDWAYNELKALIAYLQQTGQDPLIVPGSMYGAIGLCQFMPSNLKPYAIDGNNDNVVNLFIADDAIASLANFLVKHGWKAKNTRTKQHAVLMRYNKSRVYAETILQLAENIAQKSTPSAK